MYEGYINGLQTELNNRSFTMLLMESSLPRAFFSDDISLLD